VKASGATNRGRQREAEQGRRSEETFQVRRLSNLPPELAAQARAIMDRIASGELADPDAAPAEVPPPEDDE
jgi:hypothetical protein